MDFRATSAGPGLKGGISIDPDSGPPSMYFDAAVVFVTKSSLLFRLALHTG